VLNPYRLVISFIAKIYIHETMQMGFVSSVDISGQM